MLNRLTYLATSIIAGYKIANGMDTYSDLTTAFYTVSFGVLLLACILLLLMGFEIMENDYVAIVTSLIPITLSLGLATDKLEQPQIFIAVIGIGFFVAMVVRLYGKNKISALSLGAIHFLAGSVIFLLPLFLFCSGKTGYKILAISLGGSLIGITGILLGLNKLNKFINLKEKIYEQFPLILFMTTVLFVFGLSEN